MHVQVIVEGANLFVTEEARLFLEKAGCIVMKDASANKGAIQEGLVIPPP